MRNLETDNYEKISLIWNDSYDIKFMHYLFEFQGINSIFDSKHNLINEEKEVIPETVSFLGSLRKQLDTIKQQAKEYKSKGYEVLAPKISNVKDDINGFVIFEDDKSDEPITIETDFLENKYIKSVCSNYDVYK